MHTSARLLCNRQLRHMDRATADSPVDRDGDDDHVEQVLNFGEEGLEVIVAVCK